MANFDKIIPTILKHEGGLTNDKYDRGGITNYGISLTFAKDTNDKALLDVDHDGDIDANDIRKLTKEQAIKVYRKHFWDKAKLDEINSDKIALAIMDTGVNHGIYKGISMAQETLNKLGKKVDVDKIMGPQTINALNSVDPDTFVETYLKSRKNYYRRIVETRPTQNMFFRGWMNRLDSLNSAVENLNK